MSKRSLMEIEQRSFCGPQILGHPAADKVVLHSNRTCGYREKQGFFENWLLMKINWIKLNGWKSKLSNYSKIKLNFSAKLVDCSAGLAIVESMSTAGLVVVVLSLHEFSLFQFWGIHFDWSLSIIAGQVLYPLWSRLLLSLFKINKYYKN